ncbi:hypothetical protein AUJ66_06275 [Candidatus Desantisbacteria bacterium CG1_02_38_46]|uniref:Tungsten ABC transporter substrate-binding protein n=3 Tax=unclassified Candidatus Desantisiibacteriota TaxID=3106372 RepID=A0A2H9PAR7_9BACT|nr:MAG: hypothetical protein AUJ66_06275 [Candidatus Desantisbacteria bacterium CG1_02_38_46]PIU52277.1 MAG: tungsten ABC transporter substrate-binding protein [Candidatus Desantisbacteria bacterium CG07_land_8_20_14_0_80_39_15]PIZ15670.1 MAG: tungsten ABC transporter substrate-binding protein [Candidatus Desantisbacteria bacterium CG_4_10_14_0_8_um_filter_39_17]
MWQKISQMKNLVMAVLMLATTTSVQDSGLLDVLLLKFEKKYNCNVRVVAVGSGAAIRIAREGNADIIFVHDRKSEEKLIKDGFGIKRYEVMHNDFVIAGPENDPAGICRVKNAEKVFARISSTNSLFVSRGDDSGTHEKEKEIWSAIKVKPGGKWYLESGQGMIESLRIASEKNAYILTDRATYIAHRKELNLEILISGDKILYNPYSLIPISPKKYPDVNCDLAMKFVDYITKGEGRNIIQEYGIKKHGQQLFFLERKK